MISNLREDKDVIRSAIFIVFVAPLKAEVLFILEHFRTAINNRGLSPLNAFRLQVNLLFFNGSRFFAAGHVHYSQQR